jgi:hypothetical protein
MLTKEHKDKWLAALRSGEFKQGKTVLVNENKEYCCLGVLCKTLGLTDEEIDKEGYKVLTELFLQGDSLDPLWQRNDGTGNWFPKPSLNFEQIADYI